MSQDKDVFFQADALMRRHRSFLARAADTDTTNERSSTADDRTATTTTLVTTVTPAIPDESDIPLLTEVVELAPAIALAAPLTHVEQALEDEFELWLAEALPRHLAQATEKLQAELLANLCAAARTALLPRLQAALNLQRNQA